MDKINFIDLIPDSIKHDETIKAVANSLTTELQKLSDGIENVFIYSRIDKITNLNLLSHLAWQFKTPFWDEDFSLEQKQELVKNSIAWHKRRGTPSAVEDVIKAVFGSGELHEWFDYGGEPFHFKISTEAVLPDISGYQKLYEGVEAVKNKRSVLDLTIINQTKDPNYNIGLASKQYIITKRY